MRRRAFAIGVLGLLACLLTSSQAGGERRRLDRFPRLVLWAWERPEDLRGVGGDVGVAFLALTIAVSADGIAFDPRRQPLRVSPHTPLMAVTRIEAPSRRAQPLGPILDDLALAIARTSSWPRVGAIQVDFDATLSQRDDYRDLLQRVRRALPPRVPLSMTALASWCAGDAWLDGLPIDEAVPMLFEMGPSETAARFRPSHAMCRDAIGTSLDEPIDLPAGRRGRRGYVFNRRPWSDASIAAARRTP